MVISTENFSLFFFSLSGMLELSYELAGESALDTGLKQGLLACYSIDGPKYYLETVTLTLTLILTLNLTVNLTLTLTLTLNLTLTLTLTLI